MATVRVQPEPISLWTYLGIPVLVQLRNFPLVGVQVRFKEQLPHSEDPKTQAWIPEPVMTPRVDEKNQLIGMDPEATQLIQFAVLYEVEGHPDLLEMRWFSRPPDPHKKDDPFKKAVICSLIQRQDIVSVSRVARVEEASTILLT